MRVVSNLPETPTTRRLRLAADDAPFHYLAGQAAGLRLEGKTEFTPYSIASSPTETLHTGVVEFLVKVDGASRFGAHVSDIEPGTEIEIDGPYGRFTLPDGPLPGHVLFVAGGTGIAPLRAMVIEASNTQPAARLALLYSSRTPDEFAFLAEFLEMERAGRLVLTLTLTGKHEAWPHARGRAGPEHLTAMVEPSTLCFVCGSAAMVRDVAAVLETLGVDGTRIRREP